MQKTNRVERTCLLARVFQVALAVAFWCPSAGAQYIDTSGLKADVARAKGELVDAEQRKARYSNELQYKRQQAIDAIEQVQEFEILAEAASEKLAEMEKEILARQDKDSELLKAKAGLEAAKKAYQSARRKVYNSEDYKIAYQQALSASNRAMAMLKVRREAEATPALAEARKDIDYYQKKFEFARLEVLTADPQWSMLQEQAIKVREHLADAQTRMKVSTLNTAIRSVNLRKARIESKAAREFIIKGQNAIEISEAINAALMKSGGCKSCGG